MEFVFNISKGRTSEWYLRVLNNDPSTSELGMLVLAETGLEADDLLIDYDTIADILAAASNEVTNTSYVRKMFTDTGGQTRTVDDTNNRVVLTPKPTGYVTWTAPGVGDSWSKLIVYYLPVSAGADSTAVPISAHDMLIDGLAIVPSGVDDVRVAWPLGQVIAL